MVNSSSFLMRFYMKPFINEKAIVVGFYTEHLRNKPTIHSGKKFTQRFFGWSIFLMRFYQKPFINGKKPIAVLFYRETFMDKPKIQRFLKGSLDGQHF